MTKKKPAAERRAKLPREANYSREFQKSWARYNMAGRYDMNRAIEVMQILFANQEIPPEYLDHQLEGEEWDGARELHIRYAIMNTGLCFYLTVKQGSGGRFGLA